MFILIHFNSQAIVGVGTTLKLATEDARRAGFRGSVEVRRASLDEGRAAIMAWPYVSAATCGPFEVQEEKVWGWV